ncbi:MAG: DNA methyltransferase [Planctomycetota bacterium]
MTESISDVQTSGLPETITAPRTDPIYNCHSYLTKVPIAAIQPFIEAFTKPGDLVVDFFAGSGMTGIAAHTRDRKARLSDISALGQHIAKGYLAQASTHAIREAGGDVVARAKAKVGDLYKTKRKSDGSAEELVRTVWSFTYACPSCGEELVFFEALDEKGRVPKECKFCGEPFVRRNWPRKEDVPVEAVVVGANGKQVTQPISKIDIQRINDAATDPRLKKVPSLRIDETREMYSRSGLGKSGMTETRFFFSDRNAIALWELWQAINKLKDKAIRKKLQFAFTAILPRASKRYQWSAKRPLNAQNQTYYIAPVYYEWNVFDLFGRKVNAVSKATDLLYPQDLFRKERSEVEYDLCSADNLSHLGSSTVDYVFTDPPFGSNIFYSDMNLFHEAWLGTVTDHESEAVVHTTGSKKTGAEDRYEQLLRGAFEEAWRVLKPGKCMSVVFGNSSGRIWGLVQRALREAGFNATPVHVAILDKGQRSVKGLNSGSEGVVTVDLIITVRKPKKGDDLEQGIELRDGDTADLINAAIEELGENSTNNPSHVYARILQKAIQRHFVLDTLHLGDVLVALRNSGYSIDRKSGLLHRREDQKTAAG